jgi:copper chaperone CopZ
MTCKSCVARVKSELLKLGDILSAEVQLQYPQAVITMDKHISTEVLQQAVGKAGNYTIAEASPAEPVSMAGEGRKTSYFPVYLIFGYIALISTLVQVIKDSFNWMQWMSHFMAGFFLTFSFFKMINLKGFAEGYRSYDIIARSFPAWGYIYAFIELGLGIAFLTGFEPFIVSAVTLVVMAISSVGVIQSLLRKRSFQCACLGTVIKLPLSKVTLVEDLLMAGMSGGMLLAMI